MSKVFVSRNNKCNGPTRREKCRQQSATKISFAKGKGDYQTKLVFQPLQNQHEKSPLQTTKDSLPSTIQSQENINPGSLYTQNIRLSAAVNQAFDQNQYLRMKVIELQALLYAQMMKLQEMQSLDQQEQEPKKRKRRHSI